MTIHLSYLNYSQLLNTTLKPSDTVLFLNVLPKDVNRVIASTKHKLFGLALYMLPDFPDTDNQQGCCTLLDIETFLEYLDCVLDVDDLHRIIFVEDDPDKPISFSLGLAVHLKKGCNVNDAIYNQATSLPNALPSAVWCTLCLDKTLDLKGRLSQAYDDYFVTKITVNSKGHLFNASF